MNFIQEFKQETGARLRIEGGRLIMSPYPDRIKMDMVLVDSCEYGTILDDAVHATPSNVVDMFDALRDAGKAQQRRVYVYL